MNTKTKQPKQAQVQLDRAFVDAVAGPMYNTWSAIAGDAMQLEGRMTQSGAMELVLDANRMADYGGKNGAKADELVSAACEQHGYAKVARYLGRFVKFDL